MKILIVGAGVGGLACAIALRRAGHEVEVFEHAEQLRTGGNGMILWPNGTGILEEFGVSLDGLGARLDRSVQRAQDGSPLGEADWTEVAAHYQSSVRLVRRGRLVERLAESLPAGTVRLGARCVSAETRGTGERATAVAHFADGSEAEGDVLLGADGHRSAVRRHLLGDHPAAYTGWATWHGVTALPVPLTSGHEVNAFGGPAGWVALHPVGEGLLFWAFETPWTDGELVPPGALGAETQPEQPQSAAANLRARFVDFPHPVPELLEVIEDSDVGLFPHVMHGVPREWGAGRVALVGDAAHVVPPRVAQGVNQALEDAWVLSELLTGPGDPATSLRRYAQLRKPKIRALWMVAKMADNDFGGKVLRVVAKAGGQASPRAQKRNFRYFSNYLTNKSKTMREAARSAA